jgi:aminoglycoside 6'-N-acetyltransferase I
LKSRYGLEIRAPSSADAQGLCELLHAAGHAISARVMAERLDALRQEPGSPLIAAAWGPPTGFVLMHDFVAWTPVSIEVIFTQYQ